MATPFIWAGNTGQIATPQQAEDARRAAAALAASRSKVAQNGWEGLAQLANAWSERGWREEAARAEQEGASAAAAAIAGIGPNSSFEDIAGALANPWLSQPQSTVAAALLQQNMQRNDPTYQLDLDMKRAQLAALQAPQPVDPWANYKIVNDQVVTIGPDGPQAIGDFRSPDGPLVTVNNMGGEKFGEEFAKLDAQAIAQASEAGLAAQRNLPRIQQLESLLANTGGGLAPTMQQLAGNLGFETEGLSEIQAAQAIINSLVPEQRQPGSGPMSDADLALFKESLPRIINTPGGNNLIIRSMKAIAEYDAMGAQIANDLRAGLISRQEAFQLLHQRPHPLAEFYNAGVSQSTVQPQNVVPGVTIRRID